MWCKYCAGINVQFQGRSALLYSASKGRDELTARLIDAGPVIILQYLVTDAGSFILFGKVK